MFFVADSLVGHQFNPIPSKPELQQPISVRNMIEKKKRKEKLRRQSNHSLHLLRKRRHIGPKSLLQHGK